MISETAIEDLDALKAKGLTPTYADAIRLNALGLKYEAAQRKHVADSTYFLPRICKVSEDVAFRQPTVGHEIWIAKVERFLEDGDCESALAVKAFALSRPADDLPDPDSPQAIRKAVEAYADEMRGFTRDQLYAAIDYVCYGSDETSCEIPAKSQADPDAEPTEDTADWTECNAVGVLNEGRAVLWGASAADLRRMTVRELRDVITRAYVFHNMSADGEVRYAEDAYFGTLTEIENRLTKERDNG